MIFVIPNGFAIILQQGFIFPCVFFFFLLFQAEIIDVSYGNADDLKRIKNMRNITNQIALLKLGKLPLLYKVGPMVIFWWRVGYFLLLYRSYMLLWL